jgi:LPXTG-motif cell wall-anchored protein
MNGAQVTLIVLWALSVGISAAKHDQPKTGKESVWIALAGVVVMIGITWWGGFWE